MPSAYLQKLGLESQSPELNFLQKLHQRHIKLVPWENIDLYFDRSVSLDKNYITQKIMQQGRGGICFELNTVYQHLLETLGFKSFLSHATIYAFNNRAYQQPLETHIVPIVQIAGQFYLSDICWNGFRQPLCLPNDQCTDVSGKNRLRQFANNIFVLEKYLDNQWHQQYTFNLTAITLDSIKAKFNYDNAPADRKPAHHLMIIKNTQNQMLRLIDNQIEIYTGNNKQCYLLQHADELQQHLLDMFAFEASFVERLFQRHRNKISRIFQR